MDFKLRLTHGYLCDFSHFIDSDLDVSVNESIFRRLFHSSKLFSIASIEHC